MSEKELKLNFHGRIVDHLGIQMYQSPTAAIAEMISNAWDADAKKVDIQLPDPAEHILNRKIIIDDDGCGMTFDECQRHYLTVGHDKREGNPKQTSKNGRSLMGRKGIGKFAGFGIAKTIEVDTVSGETGERTRFELNLDTIRDENYVDVTELKIISEYEEPDKTRKSEKGTKITLRDLKLSRAIPEEQFSSSMARRFRLNETVDEFSVYINTKQMPSNDALGDVQYSFPRDYTHEEKPESLLSVDSDGWGVERLDDGREIKWRIVFLKDTIKEGDFQGVSVFAHKKLAQRPFMFNLSGGLPSQTGPEYMTGSVEADYVDELDDDVISTERQRLNWDHNDLATLEEWGKARIKQLLKIWKARRGEEKERQLEDKISGFKLRIENLGLEGRTVRTALKKLASLEKIGPDQFSEIGNAILTAWEGGRLKTLITRLANSADMSESELLEILMEGETIQALHTAESVKAKIEAITGLDERVRKRDLENAVRDYIAKHPWLISPEWETFAIERSVNHVIEDASDELDKVSDFSGRVDLVLGSGSQLLVLEFMRPGLKIDQDHVSRFEAYIDVVRHAIRASTGSRYKSVVGYLVADKMEKAGPALSGKLQRAAEDEKYCMTWRDLIARARKQWEEFFDHLVARAPDDPRIKDLAGSDKG